MQITEIRIDRVKNTGNYENIKLGMTAVVPEGGDIDGAVSRLKKIIDWEINREEREEKKRQLEARAEQVRDSMADGMPADKEAAALAELNRIKHWLEKFSSTELEIQYLLIGEEYRPAESPTETPADAPAAQPQTMEEAVKALAGSISENADAPGEPETESNVAKSLGDLVTQKQLGMIRAIARELGIDPDEECLSVMDCSTDELSKRAASTFITHLQDRQRTRDLADVRITVNS